ncbi:MAG: type II toxin-antitoxin system HicA family toxin [Bacillota bacterium]|nr:type II toxin-antitoxin system HicA family toxin [Bacillota bacterium]
MKRRELIKLLEKNGFKLKRHGASHDVYMRNNKIETVARHPDIPEETAKAIIRRNGLR